MLQKRVSYQKSYDHLKIVQTVVIYYEYKLFSDKVVAGHRAQIFYDGIPIDDPTKKIVYQAKTVDREAVRAALELAGLQGRFTKR